jgi:hypothetical protein
VLVAARHGEGGGMTDSSQSNIDLRTGEPRRGPLTTGELVDIAERLHPGTEVCVCSVDGGGGKATHTASGYRLGGDGSLIVEAPSAITSTHTHTTYFDTKQVDLLLGRAHHELAKDFKQRREHMSKADQLAIEARLAFLRAAWTLLLESPR